VLRCFDLAAFQSETPRLIVETLAPIHHILTTATSVSCRIVFVVCCVEAGLCETSHRFLFSQPSVPSVPLLSRFTSLRAHILFLRQTTRIRSTYLSFFTSNPPQLQSFRLARYHSWHSNWRSVDSGPHASGALKRSPRLICLVFRVRPYTLRLVSTITP
jgi:hypothetical protein